MDDKGILELKFSFWETFAPDSPAYVCRNSDTAKKSLWNSLFFPFLGVYYRTDDHNKEVHSIMQTAWDWESGDRNSSSGSIMKLL